MVSNRHKIKTLHFLEFPLCKVNKINVLYAIIPVYFYEKIVLPVNMLVFLIQMLS
jgi:hypothetical protein